MTKSKESQSSLWRTVSTTLMGMVVTGISAWLVFGQGSVGREEVARMIAAESPYVADRNAIAERLDANGKLLERIASDVGQIKIEQARMIEQLASKRVSE